MPEAVAVEAPVPAAVPAGLLLVVTVMLGTVWVVVPLVVPLATTVAVRVGDVTVSTPLVGLPVAISISFCPCAIRGEKGGITADRC